MVADKVGTYIPAFYACGALCVMGAFLIVFMPASDKAMAILDSSKQQNIATDVDELIVSEKETVI